MFMRERWQVVMGDDAGGNWKTAGGERVLRLG
jgi:hypothetical protein